MSYEFTWIPDLDQYKTDLENKCPLLEVAITEKINELAERLLVSIQAKLSGEVLQERTGNLFNSVHIQAAEWINGICQMSVGIDEDSPTYVYGIAFEMGGLGYYNIFPKNALTLAFEGPEGMIFAKHVVHPPAPHRPFIGPSLDELSATFKAELEETLEMVMG